MSAATPLTYTAEDWIAGYRLGARMNQRVAFALYLAVAIALAVQFADRPILWTLAAEAAVLAAGALTLALLRGLVMPWRARRQFERYPRAQVEHSFSLEPEGLRVTSTTSDTLWVWNDVTGWRSNAVVTILFSAPGRALVVPARLAALGFPYDELRRRLAENVKRRS